MRAEEILIYISVFGLWGLYMAKPWISSMFRKPQPTALEIQEGVCNQLRARMKEAEARSQAAKDRVNKHSARLRERLDAVKSIEVEFLQASKAEPKVEAHLQELGERYAHAQKRVSDQREVLNEAQELYDEANKALNEAVEEFEKFEDQFEKSQSEADLAAVHRFSAEAREEAKGLRGQLTAAGQARTEVHRQLEEARASAELSKGSALDRELDTLSEKEAQQTGRSELDDLAKRALEAEARAEAPASQDK